MPKHATHETSDVEQALPTSADLQRVGQLPGGPPPASLKELSTAFVALLATPATQKRLRELSGDLSKFKGCNVEAGLKHVDETQELIAIAERVQNAFVRVRQRIVENNRWLRTFQTNLARAQKQAESNSPVALGLASMVARRSAALGVAKASKTRSAKKRAKQQTKS